MRIAVIADIHGNLPALEAVLADIRRHDVTRMVNLGDCVSGPLWPREVCELLMASSNLTVRGNHDRWVSGRDPQRMGASDRFAHTRLNKVHLQWLGSLPPIAEADPGIVACHGTPANDNQHLIEEKSDCRLVRAHPSAIRKRLGDLRASVVLCGHSHQQHLIKLADGPLILNPGSVGCPSCDGPCEVRQASESVSPDARYAVLIFDSHGVSAELLSIPYDWRAASAQAEKNGNPAWARGLRTGWFL